ncbi:MAG: penicillin acylase family protein, partial [Chitinophagaceae bacterium]|nr:penicillin acylase family protein [Chitinophagaceae bacterium]
AYLDLVKKWNYRNDPNEKGVAVFISWYDSLETVIWTDEFARVPTPFDLPQEFTLIEGLLRDSIFKFTDDIRTTQIETIREMVTLAFKKAVPGLALADKNGLLTWGKYKDSGIQHLLRLSPLSRMHLITGGGTHVINATKKTHGPSWRMIVHLTDKTEAYGIYPGGQSGNPGSKFYDQFVDEWAAGKYYPLWVMKQSEKDNRNVIGSIHFSK